MRAWSRASFAMVYDGLERLTALTAPARGDRASLLSETFSYDAATNISARSGPAATYTLDGANRVTSDGLRAFVWDGADRLVQRGSDTFSYDPLGRLVRSEVRISLPPKADDAPRTLSETYAYDGDGLLRSRSFAGDDQRRPHRHDDADDDRPTTAFLWDTSLAPAPLLAAGTDRLVQGLGPLYLVAQDGRTTTLVRDALGSVRAETNTKGAITKAFRYAAYGALRQRLPASASPTLLGFAGELADLTGLLYLRARWYDPTTGRFMSRDPFSGNSAQPATLNRYAYAYGNPVLLLDPSGRCGFLISVCVGAVVGAVTGAAGAIAQGGSVQQILVAAAVGAAGGALLGVPGVGTRLLVGAGIGAVSDFVGQYSVNPNLGAVNWGSVAGAAVGGGLASYGARQTLQVGRALQADRLLTEWTAALIGVGPAGGSPLVGGAFWDALRRAQMETGAGGDLREQSPGTGESLTSGAPPK